MTAKPRLLRRLVLLISITSTISLVVRFAGVSYPHILYLWWIAFILSAGAACGYVAWKTWRLRKRHRIFRYFGLVKTALFLSTLNTGYGLVQLVRTNGLAIFDHLTWAQHRGLLFSTGLAVTLWLLALYLLNKINGSL